MKAAWATAMKTVSSCRLAKSAASTLESNVGGSAAWKYLESSQDYQSFIEARDFMEGRVTKIVQELILLKPEEIKKGKTEAELLAQLETVPAIDVAISNVVKRTRVLLATHKSRASILELDTGA